MKAVLPAQVPPYLVDWLSKPSTANPGFRRFLERVVRDERMTPVWQWVQTLPDTKMTTPPFTVCHCAYTAMTLPRKPGNLAPAERKKYFDKVRKHAKALIELLEGTGFGLGDWYMEEIDRDNLRDAVASDLSPWGEDGEDMAHVVAYEVGDGSVHKLPYTYPDSHLVEMLQQLEPWTEQDDYWGLWDSDSSGPIIHAHSASTKIIYFNCTVHRMVKQMLGVEIPFPHLSTIANVALQLKPDELVDEEAVRKQVRRYEHRMLKSKEGGQKTEKS